MDRVKAFVCALTCALVASFALTASAQDDYEVVDDADAPYIDAEGKVDYELAKEYAELVDSYVDEDGVEWEVWLDEVGGHMWAEYLTPDGLLGNEDLLVPSWINLSKYPSGSVFYNLSGSGDGHITYGGSCGRTCYLWAACSHSGYPPTNLTAIQAKAVSDDDYCDGNYEAFYDFPDGGSGSWLPADDQTCGTSGTSWYLLYDGAPDGDDDYEPNENMVYWHVHTASSQLNVEVYYEGPCIE